MIENLVEDRVTACTVDRFVVDFVEYCPYCVVNFGRKLYGGAVTAAMVDVRGSVDLDEKIGIVTGNLEVLVYGTVVASNLVVVLTELVNLAVAVEMLLVVLYVLGVGDFGHCFKYKSNIESTVDFAIGVVVRGVVVVN